jgi:hypothetical protein
VVFVFGREATKVMEERPVWIRRREEEVLEGGLGGEKLEELCVGQAELSVLVAERLGLGDQVDEASAAEIVVVVEFLVLEDQAGLVESVLSRNGVGVVGVIVDGGGTRGRAAEGDGGRQL